MRTPRGWKLVPVEPTELQLDAVVGLFSKRDIYKRMVEFAPRPPKPKDKRRKK